MSIELLQTMIDKINTDIGRIETIVNNSILLKLSFHLWQLLFSTRSHIPTEPHRVQSHSLFLPSTSTSTALLFSSVVGRFRSTFHMRTSAEYAAPTNKDKLCICTIAYTHIYSQLLSAALASLTPYIKLLRPQMHPILIESLKQINQQLNTLNKLRMQTHQIMYDTIMIVESELWTSIYTREK